MRKLSSCKHAHNEEVAVLRHINLHSQKDKNDETIYKNASICSYRSGCATSGGSGGWTSLVGGAKGLDNFNRVGDANWVALQWGRGTIKWRKVEIKALLINIYF